MSKSGAAEKKDVQPQVSAETPKAKKGAHEPVAGGCFAHGCKGKSTRFSFCDEHYEHFKFGLIKKTGEHVPDYEKKFEHFQAMMKRRGAQKVA